MDFDSALLLMLRDLRTLLTDFGAALDPGSSACGTLAESIGPFVCFAYAQQFNYCTQTRVFTHTHRMYARVYVLTVLYCIVAKLAV